MNPEVRAHSGAEAIHSIRDIWELLQHHPNSDFEHFLLICRLRPEVLAPIALGLWENGRCRALIAGRLERVLLRPSIGYARLPGIRAKALTIIHEGILGELDNEGASAVVEALGTFLAKRNADMVTIHILREESPIWDALWRRRGLALGLEQTGWMFHRELTLQKDPEFMIRNMRSKHRSWIKRKERELAESYPEKIKWSWHSENLDMPLLCEKMEAVARRTYQRGLGAGFIDDDETRKRLDLFARRRQMRVLLLETDGKPGAFWLGTVYKGVFHASATGYTPEVTKYEVGTLAFLRMVEELVREGVTRLDFGLGDASYKERFADRSWREVTIQLFARTAKGRLLQRYLGTAAKLDNITRRAVQRLGFFDRVKKAWRARLHA